MNDTLKELVGYNLSPQQLRFWSFRKQTMRLLSQMALSVTGNLRVDRLTEAIRQVVNQDTIFKSTYVSASDLEVPLQIVNDEAAFIFVEESLPASASWEDLLGKAARHEFDLQRGPLLHVSLAAQSDEKFFLIFTSPSVCADLWSLSALARMITNAYQLLSEGQRELEFDNLPYLQFAEWQNRLLESTDAEEGRRYWELRQPLATQIPALPFESSPGDGEESSSAFLNWNADPAQIASIQQLLDGTGYAIEHWLYLCWYVLLWHLTGKQSLVVGYVNSFRDFEELHNTLGLLSRCLPVSTPLNDETSFWESLRNLNGVLEIHDEHKSSFLSPESLPYAFEFAQSIKCHETTEAAFSVLFRQALTDKHKLKLKCLAQSGDVLCTIEYYEPEYDQESVDFLAHALQTILEQCSDNPHVTLGALSLLDTYYTQRLLHTFTDTSVNFAAAGQSVAGLFEAQAAKYPEHLAVVCGGARLTYAELNRRAGALAAHLRSELGLGAGDRVGLMCDENERLIIGMLGILKAGGAFVPLDPGNPPERLEFILQDSNLKALVTESDLQSHAAGYAGQVVCLDTQEASFGSSISMSATRAAEDVMYVIYTSGTTGRPKGTLIRDKSLVNYVCWLQHAFSLTPADSSALLSSYAFDLGYTSIWGTLLTGGSLHLVPPGLIRKPEALIDYLMEQRISFIKTTPSLFQVIARAANSNELSDSDLRLVLLGGEQILVKDVESFLRLKPGVTMVNHYGPTETTVGALAHKIDASKLSAYRRHPVIGRPVANLKVYVLNEENQPVPPGIDGELYIAGVGLAQGYLHRAELTEEKFVANPFIPGTKMYRTGDVARWMPDGNVLYVGRRDDQVKIRGYRIELEEVRQAMLAHSLIRDAVVIAVAADGESQELAAYFVADADIKLGELREFLADRLPQYMLPGYFVPLDTFPLTPNGKLDKKGLPAPQEMTLKADSIYLAPRNKLESQLVSLWQRVLGRERIGVRDNFFELGGNSLKAIQLLTRLHKELNLKIELSDIFSHLTVEALSRAIETREKVQFFEIEPLPEQPYYEVSHAQRRLLVLSQFNEGSVAYNVPAACILEGALDSTAFRHAFRSLIQRHENLRTVFVEVEGTSRQRILSAEAIGFSVEEQDLRREPDAEATVRELARQEAAQPFDLTVGPLLRARLMRIADEVYVFVFNIHHVISDGWSRGILIQELLAFYDAYLKGRENPLPPLRLQYKDYVAWHNAAYAGQGAYWEEVYRDSVPALDFPLDHERPRILSFAGEMIRRTVPERLTAELRRMAGEHNMTLNNVLLALYAVLLGKYSAQEDIIVGSLVSGRNHGDLENLIGIFINYLPIRLFPRREWSLNEFLQTSNQTFIRAYENQDYPFDLLVEHYIRQRDISRNPFFDTMLNFHSEDEIEGHERLIHNQLPGLGLRVRPYELESANSALDFRLDIRPAEKTLGFHLYYNSNLFERKSMELLLDKFVLLLETACSDPHRKLADYLLFTPEEEQQLAVKASAHNRLSRTTTLPVHICASFVAEPVEEYLEYWGAEFEMNLEISFAPYNQVFQQLLNPESELHRNNGLRVLFLRVEDWLLDLKGLSPAEQSAHLEQTFAELTRLLEQCSQTSVSPYMVGVMQASAEPAFDATVLAVINTLTASLRSFIESLHGFYLLDLERMANLYDLETIFDRHTDEAGHMPFTQEYYAALGTYLARQIHAWKATVFKVIALDCDNTLWKGICGEVGTMGVVVDQDCAALQRFLLEKHEEGFLLALCSKNNEEDVWDVFERHPAMLLKREQIIAHRINWQPKSANLASIADELNVGLDSFIFIDDSSFEVEEIASRHDGVLGLTLPAEPNSYADFLAHIWAFDRFVVTDEDRGRHEMYRAERRRQEERTNFAALDDFYKSLNLQIDIEPLDEKSLRRAAQLTQRTNQFNLNGNSLNEEELRQWMHRPDALHWTLSVKDRFGEYGLVGLLLAHVASDSLSIETFLLSCRVLGRGVEEAILTELQKHCQAQSLAVIKAQYRNTGRNRPFAEFMTKSNWQVESDDESTRLAVADIVPTDNYQVIN